jgi:4-azaleucine resistance transporter AzlC
MAEHDGRAASIGSAREEFFAGARAMIPMIAGAAPFGVLFGAVAAANGISPAGTLGLSALVFAGSSQFIAVSLFAAGTALPLIALTTFIVNLRHALYGATLAPHVRHLPIRWLIPLAYTLTDESFAIVSQRFASRSDDSPWQHWYFLGANGALYLNWQMCTLLGIVAGTTLPDLASWGLDFAIVATFIGIVVPGLTTRPVVAAVIASGAVALLANPLPNRLGLLAAALVGAAVGFLIETARDRHTWQAGQPINQPENGA